MSSIMRRNDKFYLRYVDVDGTERTRLARGATTEAQALALLHEIDLRLMQGQSGIPLHFIDRPIGPEFVRPRSGKTNKISTNDEEYLALFESQEGKCAICRMPGKPRGTKADRKMFLAVDHCHVTGKRRGLLCVRCNGRLGTFHAYPVDTQ